MADETVTPLATSARSDRYTPDDARMGLQQAMQAKAILRSVQLAVAAQEDGAVVFDGGGAVRWGPAIGAAAARVALVRDSLMEKSGAPAVDWTAALVLLEAFDAALWQSAGRDAQTERMQADEVSDMAQVAIDELDRLAQGLADTLH